MKPVLVDLARLKPDPRNARKHSARNIQEIMRSLRQNEQYRPFVVQKSTGYIIVGNGMYEAMKLLGVKKAWVEYRDITNEQAEKLALSDNRTAELAEWDPSALKDLFQELGPEPDIAGWTDDEIAQMFEVPADIGSEDEDEYPEQPEDANLRTVNTYNLGSFDPERAAGFYQMPEIRKCCYVPKKLIGFNYVLSSDDAAKRTEGLGVHFYIDDYQFERVWSRPGKYIERLAGYSCVLTPDFSLYMNMPVAMKVWNIYRSRLLGQMMQDAGLNVIPTLSWAGKDTFAFCFDGIEPGGSVSVSTGGVLRDKQAIKIWRDGMDEAIKRLSPSCVVLYGNGRIDYDWPCRTVYISNSVTERMRGSKNPRR